MGRSHGARARGSERRRGRIRGRQGDQSYRSPAQEREGGLERVLRNTSYRTWSRIQREKRMYVDVPFTLCCLNDQLIIISLLVLLVRAMASLRSGLTLVFCRGFFLSHFFVTLFGFRDSHERRYCDTQKAQKKALCGQQVSGIRGPRWLLFVVVCLVVAMLTRSFLPLAALHPPFPRCSVRPATCSLDEEPTESGVCRGRTGGGRGGKVKREVDCLVDADWWTAVGGFRGPCLPVFIRDLAKISRFSNHLSRFPGPPLCHPVTVTLFLSHSSPSPHIPPSTLVPYSTLLNDKH